MKPQIQFLSTKPMLGYGTTEMRCMQPAALLRADGWRTAAGSIASAMPAATQTLVLHRTPLTPLVAKIVRLARLEGVAVILDLDDLIESPEGTATRSGFAQGIERTIEAVDHVTVSTEFLHARVTRLVPRCTILRNALSHDVLEAARAFVAARAPRQGQVVLGYLSGSAHHDSDFKIAEPALLQLMWARPHVHLLVAGKVRFSPEFHAFGERFRYEPFRPYAEFVALLDEIDINLVPLEVASDFAQARSELKYIEAGAFEVPSVASPTGTYQGAIEDGVNGRLCAAEDWFATLDALTSRPEERRLMGRRARANVEASYTPAARRAEWSDLLAQLAGGAPAGPPRRARAVALRLCIRAEQLKRNLRRQAHGLSRRAAPEAGPADSDQTERPLE